MSKTTDKPKARYKVLVGMNYDGKRFEPGEMITFPEKYDAKWLLKRKAIEEKD